MVWGGDDCHSSVLKKIIDRGRILPRLEQVFYDLETHDRFEFPKRLVKFVIS